MPPRPIAALLTAVLIAAIGPAFAQDASTPDWPTEKCNRYKKAYEVALNKLGKTGIGQEFFARHDAFLASNCSTQADVCPRSREEFELANTLVILGMNQRLASTFMPFACRKE